MHRGFLSFSIVVSFAVLAGVFFLNPAPVLAAGGPPAGSGGGGETSLGNNLSTPVYFAEGIGLTGLSVSDKIYGGTGMRGDLGELWLDLRNYGDLGLYFLQQTEAEWQADWVDASQPEYLPGNVIVDAVDWSDNLVRNTWTERSMIRVEVVLFKVPDVEGIQGYWMDFLGGSGQGEVWGTPQDAEAGTGTRFTAEIATVYSCCARLTIHKLNWTGDESPTGSIPDTFAPGYATHVAATYIDSAVFDKYGVDGRTGAYAAEVNVSGKAIYGYVWDMLHFNPDQTPQTRFDIPGLDWPADVPKEGWYRITFSLDSDWNGLRRNAVLSALDPGDVPLVVDEEGETGTLLYPPALVTNATDPTGNYTYIDIRLRSRGGTQGGGRR